MLWRVRTNLPDRPGALAAVARGCGEAGVDIRRVQVFPGRADDDSVTDELVLETPEGMSRDAVVSLVRDTGGADTHALPCTDAALEDQPTRYVEAARTVIARPASFPDVVAHLFDAETAVPDCPADVMELRVGDVQVQIRRPAPFTPTERERGLAMASLVSDALLTNKLVLDAVGGEADGRRRATRPGAGAEVSYVVRDAAVQALAGGEVVGQARLHPAPEDEADLREIEVAVDGDWRRGGLGTRLLGDGARLARRLGATELLVRTRADNQAVMPMIFAAGMSGRIRMAGDELTVRIPLRDIRPLAL